MNEKEFIAKLAELLNEFEKNQEFINKVGCYITIFDRDGYYEWSGDKVEFDSKFNLKINKIDN